MNDNDIKSFSVWPLRRESFRIQGIQHVCISLETGGFVVPEPHGGLRTVHQKSTCLRAIDFRAMFGTNSVASPPKFGVRDLLKPKADVE